MDRMKLAGLRMRLGSVLGDADSGGRLAVAATHQVLMELLGMLLDEPSFPPGPSEGAPLKPGDVVRLASGGPMMTVTGEMDGGRVVCAHFEGSGMYSPVLPPAALVRVEDEQRRDQRDKDRRKLLERACGALVGAEAVLRGRQDIDAERVKGDVAETIQALLSDAAEEA